MAKASYAPMFETVSGALNKINKKSPHAQDQKMVLTTHRKAPTTSPDCSRVYLRGLSSVSRTTPVTAKETQVRTKFAAVSAAVNARVKTTSPTYADDYAAFLAQKDAAQGKTTFRSYIWSLESAAYDSEHQG
ncbi:MAG: hypothetical protein IK073_05480 [Paludibacteraceae bacterium]|nr:hypothetical protein [Paludibacteraceae bacterium]